MERASAPSPFSSESEGMKISEKARALREEFYKSVRLDPYFDSDRELEAIAQAVDTNFSFLIVKLREAGQ